MGLSDQDIVALSGGHTLVCSFLNLFDCVFKNCFYWQGHDYVLIFREELTRIDLGLKVLGHPILLSSTTHTSSEFCFPTEIYLDNIQIPL